MEKNLKEIRRYVDFLHERFGLNITVHACNSSLAGITAALGELNIHSNPYCTYIKSIPGAWDECILRQKRMAEHLRQNGCNSFWGSCYAGAGEYVIPICENELYGFISVGGYRGNENKMRHFAQRYAVSHEKACECFEKYLNAEPLDTELTDTLIAPLCAMLILAMKKKPPEYDSQHDKLIHTALYYLHRNYSAKVNLSAAAKFCHCSTRTLSRIFMRETGMSVGAYIEKLRMEKAAMLLKETRLPIVEAAFQCGYGDAGYFSDRFSRYYGQSPTCFRQENTAREHTEKD